MDISKLNINDLKNILQLYSIFGEKLSFIENHAIDNYWTKETKIKMLKYWIDITKEHFKKLKSQGETQQLKNNFEKYKKEKLQELIDYSKEIKNNL